MSYCTTASCLAHRRGIFIRLDAGQPYPWVHTDISPCEAVAPATAEQAGEVCACGHERHKAAPGPLPHGMIGKLRPCADCPCQDFRHQWQEPAAPETVPEPAPAPHLPLPKGPSVQMSLFDDDEAA